jgi:hypothetical protein
MTICLTLKELEKMQLIYTTKKRLDFSLDFKTQNMVYKLSS